MEDGGTLFQPAPPGRGRGSGGLHIVFTVNAAWNLVNFRTPLIRALVADGHRVTAVAPLDQHAAALTAMGCRLVPLAMNNQGTGASEDLRLIAQFVAIFRRERPDLVLSFTIKNNIYGALVGKALGIPVIPNVTGLGTVFIHRTMASRVAGLLYRFAFRRLPIVFFQNEDDRDLFLAERLVPRDAPRILPGSGIDLRHFAPRPRAPRDGTVIFLLIARLLWDKGVGEFIEAARIVRQVRPDTRFRLLGATGVDNRTAIDATTVNGWVREGVVTWLGTTDDVRPAIAEADCVVLPSYREGTPRTLLEAAAMARPVVATRVPGCRSAVEDGRTGLLCRPRDAADLAAKLLAMIDLGPAARIEMGAQGRAKMARDYDDALVVAAYRKAVADARNVRVVPRQPTSSPQPVLSTDQDSGRSR